MQGELEALEDVTHSTPLERTVAILLGFAAVLGAALAMLEAATSRAEGTADAHSTRLAVQIPSDGLVIALRETFQIRATQEAIRLDIAATSRALVGTIVDPSIRDQEAAVAGAQDEAAKQVELIAETMGAVPRADGRLDARTRRALSSTLDQLGDLVREQNRQLDLATKAGKRHGAVVLGLTILALAAILLGLAASLKEARIAWLIVGVAGLLLAVSLTLGAVALA
jgi:hypothetical protein